MQEIYTGFILIFAEVGAVLLLAFVYVAWRSISHRSRTKKHVENFLKHYNDKKTENLSSVISSLENGCNMERDDAEKHLSKISASERAIYKHVLNLAIGKEKNNTFKIEDKMQGLSENWLDTVKTSAKNAADSGGSKMDIAHLREQLEFLKGENSRISENYLHMRARLETAVELLGNLVKEYSMLYSGDGQSSQIVDAIEEELTDIKRAMQQADAEVGQEPENKDG
jgi:chromosome segregation ATPase